MIRQVIARPRPRCMTPEPPASLDLASCYRYCEAVSNYRPHNYPVASVFVPSSLRRHIWAVYAFARCADDFADEPQYEGRRAIELDRWEERLEACYFGEPPDHPVFVALGDTIQRFSLPITEFSALLSGFRAELEESRYATFTHLRRYTALAMEPVAHLLLYLSGYRDPALHRYADDLATGVALSRFWQDIPADMARGRIYVPGEDLHHFGVTEEDIEQRRVSPAVAALIRYEVARTRALFERARPLVDLLGLNLSVEMALIWHGGMRILEKIAAAGPKVMQQRPQFSALDKALVVQRALSWRGSSLRHRFMG